LAQNRKKFATQLNSEILDAIRSLAEKEGRPIEALVEEAFTDLVEKHKKAELRAHVMDAYVAGRDEYGPLYKKLAE